MNRLVILTGCVAGALAVGLVATGTAHAATPTPATSSPGMYGIEMDISNNSTVPLTLFDAEHNNYGHWQQQSPTTIPADSSATVTAYTDDPAGFETSLDYLTPDGHSVLLQAVNYAAKSNNTGDSNTDDPALSLTSTPNGGMFATYDYFLQASS